MSQTVTLAPRHGNIFQACDSCRLKKRKCDLSTGVRRCSACEKSDSICKITHVTKPRERRKKKQMENLEDRLRSLEDLIKNSLTTSAPAQPQDLADAVSSPSPTASTSLDTMEANPTTWASHPADLASQRSGTDYSRITQTEQLRPDLHTVDIDLRPLTRTNGVKKCSLPPAQGGLFLLQEYLVDFNTAVPLFDAEIISALFLDCYNDRADGQVISWVTLYVVLAIAHRLRAMSPLGVQQDTENVQTYLEEAMAEIPAMILMSPSLLLAQCYLGIAIVLLTSSRPQPAATLVVIALHVLQDLKVNDPFRSESGPEEPDRLQRDRVFWIAYCIDTEISIRTRRLPSISPRLISVELPADDTSDGIGEIRAAEGDFKVKIFRIRAQLGLLQADIAEQYFTRQTTEYSWQTMENKLNDWGQNSLFKLDPEDLVKMVHRSDLVHILSLYSMHFSTIYTLHVQRALGHKITSSPFTAAGLAPAMAHAAAALPYHDARKFVGLLQLVPGDNIPCNWLMLESIAAALVTVLTHIMHNPHSVQADSDFAASKPTLNIFYQLLESRKDPELTATQHLCADLYLRTDRVIQQRRSGRF